MTPEELDALAKNLHHEWDSPALWPRIARMARPRRRWWPRVAVLTAVAAALTVALLWMPRGRKAAVPIANLNAPLLTDDAMAAVQAAETAYRNSNDRLARVAAPKLNDPSTPLLQAYAEKIRVLDVAIAGLRGELDKNRFNTHLHLQMAAVYRDKQQTLEQVLRHE
jgi:hypothetical protein